tara:strand:- start:38 stop:457 length:420 start_codon:yes stop_codon:yes gene_type:complete
MKIWTNGCFDVLHRGHIELFRYAKSLGDELVVGIDTDDKVKKDKSEDRPINNLQDRMFMLQSIKYIDKVIPFDSTEDLRKTIRWYQPDLMVIGSDWKGKDVIGREFSDKLVFFDRVGDYSTTKILQTNDEEVDWTLQTR